MYSSAPNVTNASVMCDVYVVLAIDEAGDVEAAH